MKLFSGISQFKIWLTFGLDHDLIIQTLDIQQIRRKTIKIKG